MGYYASYGGTIQLKEVPTHKIIDEVAYTFEGFEFDKELKEINVGGDGKYFEDTVIRALEDLIPFVKSGLIEYTGEDGCHWRFRFENDNWEEENGNIYYDNELPAAVSIRDQPEFIHEIVSLCEEMIGTSVEDRLTNELTDLMKKWKVFK